MRHQDPLGGPGKNLLDRYARGGSIDKGGSELSWHLRLWSYHQIQSCNETAPTGEPTDRKALNEIGEKYRSALAMKKHDLGGDGIACDQDLIDLIGPSRWRF